MYHFQIENVTNARLFFDTSILCLLASLQSRVPNRRRTFINQNTGSLCRVAIISILSLAPLYRRPPLLSFRTRLQPGFVCSIQAYRRPLLPPLRRQQLPLLHYYRALKNRLQWPQRLLRCVYVLSARRSLNIAVVHILRGSGLNVFNSLLLV